MYIFIVWTFILLFSALQINVIKQDLRVPVTVPMKVMVSTSGVATVPPMFTVWIVWWLTSMTVHLTHTGIMIRNTVFNHHHQLVRNVMIQVGKPVGNFYYQCYSRSHQPTSLFLVKVWGFFNLQFVEAFCIIWRHTVHCLEDGMRCATFHPMTWTMWTLSAET